MHNPSRARGHFECVAPDTTERPIASKAASFHLSVFLFVFFALCLFRDVLMHATIIISHSLIQMSAERNHPHMCNSVQIPSWDRWWKISALLVLIGGKNKSMGMKL